MSGKMDRIFKKINKSAISDHSNGSFAGSEDESNVDFDPIDSDEDYKPETYSKRLAAIKRSKNGEQMKIERMPTRRPNPKICNRNALMARENRQKKKELMEKLEQENLELKNENVKLKKLLKDRRGKIEKLSMEQQYLRSVIANKTEILSVLKSVKTTRIPTTSSLCSYSTTDPKSPDGRSSVTSADNDYELSDDLNLFLDDEMGANIGGNSRLDNQLELEGYVTNSSPSREVINSEHNYFELDNKQKLLEPGVCVHIKGGKISFEFCSKCTMNAGNAWEEEEEDDDDGL